MIFTFEKLAKAYVLYRIKTVKVCLKTNWKFRGLVLFFNFFSWGFNFADGQLQIFRWDLISRFFLNPRNPRNLIPAKFNPLKVVETNCSISKFSNMSIKKRQDKVILSTDTRGSFITTFFCASYVTSHMRMFSMLI